VDGFNVTAVIVMGAGTNCGTTAEDVYTELNALRSYVDGLGAAWLGMTASKFTALMEQWRIDALNIHEGLVGMGEILKANASNYIMAEESNLAGMPSLT
jgi:WXG100 family type VII secretion target